MIVGLCLRIIWVLIMFVAKGFSSGLVNWSNRT